MKHHDDAKEDVMSPMMDPVTYPKSTETMVAFALSNTDPVIARVERSCSINGFAFVVQDGDRTGQYVALSVGWLRHTNHMHPGLLFQVASTEDEALRYPVALTLNPAT